MLQTDYCLLCNNGYCNGSLDLYESQCEKTNILVFDQVQHNLGCTATGAGKRLKFSDLVTVLAMW